LRAAVGAPDRPTTVDAFLAGDPDQPVSGVAVTWLASLDVLRRAADAGCDLVLSHETPFYDHGNQRLAALAQAADPALTAKLALVKERGLVIWQFHDHWHDRRPDGVDAGVLAALGWGPASDPAVTVPPTTLADLAALVADRLAAPTVRYLGDPALIVRRVGWALGFRGFEAVRRQLLADLDAVLIGEGHEWEVGSYAADLAAAGRPRGLIVLGHLASEQAGLAAAAHWLEGLGLGPPVRFIPTADPYRPV
jgi:putative NIF3 family GTP cyclohydrolase 1 type 2